MGDWNQLEFARRHRDLFALPALEVGSKDYGNTQDLRSLLGAGPGDYLGLDQSAGPGVDLVFDLAEPFERVDEALGGRRFRSAFCLSVLEHCRQPFVMADNITRLLEPGGVLFVSVPHVWEIHAYPSDYWRFTAEGVVALFPGLQFDLTDGEAAHCKPGVVLPLVEQPGLVWHNASFQRHQGQPLRALRTVLGKLLLGERALHANTMINLIGRKPGEA